MKKRILLIIYCLITTLLYANTYIDASEQEWTYGSMHQWRAHNSYTVIEEIVVIDNMVYALSNHSLFAIDQTTEEIHYYDLSTGLNSTIINHIYHNEEVHELMLC